MTVSERKIWVDGKLRPWEEVTVHVLSQSIQRGSLVFDVMPAYARPGGTVIFGMREHTERFLGSMRLNGMEIPYGLDEMLVAIGEAVRANPGTQVVKISAYYPGIALDVLPVDAAPSVAIAAFGVADVLPPGVKWTGEPARLQVAEPIKLAPTVLSPQIKIAAGYTAAAQAKRRARAAGFDDILFLDGRGDVAESSTQSFFLIERGVILTAPLDTVLAGITRRAVLELIEDEGIPCKQEPITRGSLARAEEAFLTGTTINVWPVARIDARAFPEPVPGPITARLSARLERVLDGEDPEFSPRWMQAV
jgi:branched-chain amino acid aminotransferase